MALCPVPTRIPCTGERDRHRRNRPPATSRRQIIVACASVLYVLYCMISLQVTDYRLQIADCSHAMTLWPTCYPTLQYCTVLHGSMPFYHVGYIYTVGHCRGVPSCITSRYGHISKHWFPSLASTCSNLDSIYISLYLHIYSNTQQIKENHQISLLLLSHASRRKPRSNSKGKSPRPSSSYVCTYGSAAKPPGNLNQHLERKRTTKNRLGEWSNTDTSLST